jgi:hypothetical protein
MPLQFKAALCYIDTDPALHVPQVRIIARESIKVIFAGWLPDRSKPTVV